MIRNAVEDSVCKVEVTWGWNCALCKFGPCFEVSVYNYVYVYIDIINVFLNLHLFKSTVYDLMLHVLPYDFALYTMYTLVLRIRALAAKKSPKQLEFSF